jgi:minor extracellular protease Epr
MTIRHFTTTVLVASLLWPLIDAPKLQVPGAAFAQDDDDNGGDSDDDGAGGFGNGGVSDGGTAPRRTQPRTAPPPPLAAPDEIMVTDLSPESLALLQAEGFTTLSQDDLATLGRTLQRLRIPSGLTLEAARDRVRTLPEGEDADLNHFYRPTGGEGTDCAHANCRAFSLVGWPDDRAPDCRVTLPIGIIDTGVNPDHDIIAPAGVEVLRLTPPGAEASAEVHGTAVASLLVGAPGSRVPGLVPEAKLIAVDAFIRQGSDERADVAALLRGIDLLAQRGVRVMNLSLSGPPNAVLAEALDTLQGPEGVVIVAAAGNAGPGAPPAFPAAYPGVLAVTAVDARGRIYRAAQRGSHLDLAAPGVDLLAATSIRGARGQSGTSYAAPFVTAAAAILLSRDPTLTPAAIADRLRGTARDLGAVGPDEVYGAGLLNTATLCAPPVLPAGAGAGAEDALPQP